MATGYNVANRRNYQVSYVYPDLDTGDVGDSLNFFQEPLQPFRISVQVAGLNNSTMTLKGSNDGTNFHTLKDVDGNDVAVTANGIYQIDAITQFARPEISGGTDTGVVVTVLAVM